MDNVLVNISSRTVVGGWVDVDGDRSGDYTTGLTNLVGVTDKSFAVFSFDNLPSYARDAILAGQVGVVLTFNTSTSSALERTLHVYGGNENPATATEIANPSKSNGKAAYNQLNDSNFAQLATIAVRKGVPPFSSDENQNATQSINITSQVVAALRNGQANLLLWFSNTGAATADSLNVTNLSINVQGLLPEPSTISNSSDLIVAATPFAPFAGVTVDSSVPDALTNGPIELLGDYADNSAVLAGSNSYFILQSNAASGTLSGPGLAPTPLFVSAGQAGYLISGTNAEITAKLRALTFTPLVGASGQVPKTTFTIEELNGLSSVLAGTPVPLAGGVVTYIGNADNFYADVPAGSTEVVLNGGTTNGIVIGAALVFPDGTNGEILVSSQKAGDGGTVTGTSDTGGLLEVAQGGRSIGAQIRTFDANPDLPGTEQVDAGGASTGTHVYAGSDEIVLAGGRSTSPVIDAGGIADIYGVVDGATVAGTMTVYTGGIATKTVVGSGGKQIVQSHGQAVSTTVSGNGSLTVYSGGSIGLLTIAGGTVVLKDGANVSGTITFSGTGSLEVDAPITATSNFPAVISGFSPGSAIDFVGLSYTSASTVTLSNTNVTVSNGVAAESFRLKDSSVQTISLSDDGQGGTLVAAPLSLTGGGNSAAPVAPFITGGRNSVIKGGSSTLPFYGVQVADPNYGSAEKITIRLSDGGAGGTLSGPGLTGGTGGIYSLAGSADAVTAELGQLKFTAASLQPNSAVTTTFTLTDATTVGTTTTNTGFSVTINTPAAAPTLAGTAALTTVSEAAVTPFAAATVTDPNANSSDVLTIKLSGGGAGGVLSGAGLSSQPGGIYTLSGTAAQVTAALQALVFTPTIGTPGNAVTTKFSLTDTTTPGLRASSNSFSVTNTDPAVAPTLTGAAALAVQSEAASTPFATAALADPNFNSTDTLTIQLSNGGAGGVLSGAGLSGGTLGAYTLSGPAGQVLAALQALVFTPAKGAPGTSTTTTFSLTDTTALGTSATNAGFSVTNTDPPPPSITSDIASPGTGAYSVGQQITFTLVASAAVTVTGTPTLTLNDGGAATYDPTQSTATSLVFRTTVAAGQNAATLAVTGVTLPGGATIRDGAGNDAVLTGATASFNGLQVDTIAPTVAVSLASDTGASSTDGITSNGMLTGSGEPNGVVTISNGASVLGTAPTASDGSWSFKPTLADGRYTLTASQADAAGNVGRTTVSLTLNTAAPANTPVPSPVAEKGANPAVLATVAPGTAGDTLLLSQAGGTGLLSLGPVRNGVQQVLYTATAASGQDTVRYTISDQQSGVSTPGLAVVQLDPGPTAGTATSTVKLGSSTNLTSLILDAVSPGLKGDTLTLTADNVTGTLGAVSLVNGQLTYAATGSSLQHIKANGSAADSFTYTVSDQYGGIAVGTLKLTVTNPANPVKGPAFGNGAIQGTSGTDIITALGWNNTIYGNGGNDVVNAGQGSATVYTAGGDVVVNLNGFNNAVQGFAKAGAAGATGADGNVTVSGSQGGTTVYLGNGQDNVSLGGFGNSVVLGNGNNTVSGAVGLTAIKLGDGKNNVSLAGFLNTIEVGNGQNTIVAGAGIDQVKAGSGNNTIMLAGWGNTVTLGAGTDLVQGGSGDTITISGTTLALKGGFAETVFVGPGTSSLDDLSSGTRVAVGKTSGSLSISDLIKDPGFVLNLTEGVGGFKTASSVVAALRTDGHGGTLLMLGTGASATTIDFLNTSSSVLSAGHFRIG